MSKKGKFLIYCIELYKSEKNLSGNEVESLFSTYGIWEYIYDCFEALHTTGEKYIINDIDQYIAARQ